MVGCIAAIALIGALASLALLGFGVSQSEPAKLLTVLGLIASSVVLCAAAVTTGLLLWGGFVSQYVAALDAKAQVVEVFECDEELLALEPAQANGEMLRIVSEDMLSIVEAVENSVDRDQAESAQHLVNNILEFRRRLSELEDAMSHTAHENVFNRVHTRFVRVVGNEAMRVRKKHEDEDGQPVTAAWARVANVEGPRLGWLASS